MSTPKAKRRWPIWLKAASVFVVIGGLGAGAVGINLLSPPILMLDIRTEPPGREISLDGKVVGNGKVSIRLPMHSMNHGPSIDNFPTWLDRLATAIQTTLC